MMLLFLKKHKKRIYIFLIIFLVAISLFITDKTPQSVYAGKDLSEPIEIPIIMYHGLIENRSCQNQYMISPYCFEDDLKYLKENGWNTIFVSELVDYVKNKKNLPEKSIILTFDDGYYNNYVYAFPLLKKYNMKAVISPIAITADEAMTEKTKNPAYSQCSWKELLEMQKSGFVEIQNHTYNLHKINSEVQGAAPIKGENISDYKIRLTDDIKKANDRIFAELKTTTCAFVYPFGAKTSDTEKIILELGFEAALDCEEKINIIYSKDDLYHLHRFLRPNDISAETFFQNKLNLISG